MPTPLCVVVTRPTHQAAYLQRVLTACGHRPLMCPCLIIEPIEPRHHGTPEVPTERACDIAIFVSRNAVEHANRIAPLQSRHTSDTKVFAIGPATLDALRALGLAPTPLIGAPFDSENLLRHPILQDIAGRRVSLYRGVGGRRLISDTLNTRGAHVVEHVVYRRRAPTDSEFEHSQKDLELADVILCGSDEALTNLVTLASETNRPHLLRTALIVNSTRGKEHAEHLGFSGCIRVACPAGDDGQLEALARLAL